MSLIPKKYTVSHRFRLTKGIIATSAFEAFQLFRKNLDGRVQDRVKLVRYDANTNGLEWAKYTYSDVASESIYVYLYKKHFDIQ